MKKVLNVIYQIDPIYRMTKLHRLEQEHYHQNMFKIADDVLEEQKSVKTNDIRETSEENFEEIPRKQKNYVETLLRSQALLNHEEIRDEINTLVAAVS